MVRDFVAGCIGGSAGVIVGHPLDTVKVHLQTQNALRPKYQGTMHCLSALLRTQGMSSIYRGMTSPLMGVAAINAIVFGVYGNIERHYLHADSTFMAHFAAGAAAGLVQSPICSPMELAKSRMQVTGRHNGHASPWECLKAVYRTVGMKGVFRGHCLTIAREVPAFGSYFATYAYIMQLGGATSSDGTVLFAGGMAGVVSWVLIYPIDVLKSRFQIDGGATNGAVVSYKNSWDCLRQSVHSEGGYRWLYRGLAPTVVRAFPVNAATFLVVSWTARLLTNGERWLQSALVEGSGGGGGGNINNGRWEAVCSSLKLSTSAAEVSPA